MTLRKDKDLRKWLINELLVLLVFVILALLFSYLYSKGVG